MMQTRIFVQDPFNLVGKASPHSGRCQSGKRCMDRLFRVEQLEHNMFKLLMWINDRACLSWSFESKESKT